MLVHPAKLLNYEFRIPGEQFVAKPQVFLNIGARSRDAIRDSTLPRLNSQPLRFKKPLVVRNVEGRTHEGIRIAELKGL